MSNRLLVNPGTPQAWEIPLKPGANRLGRGEQNDFQVNHPSVSGSHCEITVSSAGVLLKDLGSTNGTFVNRAPVREVLLQSGQELQLGSVNMVFESLANPSPAPPSASPAPAVRLSSGGLRISNVHAEPSRAPAEEPPMAPPLVAAPPQQAAPPSVVSAFCKFHPKTPARFHCARCQKFYCDMCVTTRTVGEAVGKFCRACGQALSPVQVTRARAAGGKGFFARIPGAFLYPFRGVGVLILICATLAFSALNFVGGFWIIVFYGFLFLFMQNIIHTTASDEKEPLGFPDPSGIIGAAFQLGATILTAFGPAIGLAIARYYEIEIPGAAIIAAMIFGCLYFPMAFLAVAMKDTVVAANPLVVIPAIFKIPLEYLTTCILLIGVFAVRQLGDFMSAVAGGVSMSTKDMSVLFMALGMRAGWAFASIYLLTVSMRILGLMYITKKEKFGWFSR